MTADDGSWTEPEVERVCDPVWECIYCGASSDNLGKEHIVPFGLGGTFVLPRASCEDCGDVTGKVEQTILRGQMWNVRALRRIQSRHPDKMPTKGEPVVITGEGKEERQLPLNEYPVLLHMPVFPRRGT